MCLAISLQITPREAAHFCPRRFSGCAGAAGPHAAGPAATRRAAECSLHFPSGVAHGYYSVFTTGVPAIVKPRGKARCAVTPRVQLCDAGHNAGVSPGRPQRGAPSRARRGPFQKLVPWALTQNVDEEATTQLWQGDETPMCRLVAKAGRGLMRGVFT